MTVRITDFDLLNRSVLDGRSRLGALRIVNSTVRGIREKYLRIGELW